MPKRKSNRISKQSGNSSPAAKKIKEGPATESKPSVAEPESIFEAARRRHQGRQKAEAKAEQTIAGSAATSASSKPTPSSYESWKQEWMRSYPHEQFIDAVGAVRRTVPNPASKAVYVVIHHYEARWRKGADLDVLATYSTPSAANDCGLGFFSNRYPQWLDSEEQFTKKQGSPDMECAWDVDVDGCMSLEASDEDGDAKVFVSKRVVDAPYQPKRSPSSEY